MDLKRRRVPGSLIIKIEILLVLILIIAIFFLTLGARSKIQGYAVASENSFEEPDKIMPRNLKPVIESLIVGKSTIALETEP